MPSGLGSVERDFPSFGRQVPTGSVALIGYTVGSYSSRANPQDVSLSMNVLWVAVLAASEDSWQASHYLHFIFFLIIAFQVAVLFSVSFMMTRSLGWWKRWSNFWLFFSFYFMRYSTMANLLTPPTYRDIAPSGTQLQYTVYIFLYFLLRSAQQLTQ